MIPGIPNSIHTRYTDPIETLKKFEQWADDMLRKQTDKALAQLTLIGPAAGNELRSMVYGDARVSSR